MISVTYTADSGDLARFPDYANRKLRTLVNEGRKHGERRMQAHVPRGESKQLVSAVDSIAPAPAGLGDGHYTGVIGVRASIAPYALRVDQGTGVDGPFGRPVSVTRPAKTRAGRGAMSFQKNAEPPRAKTTVKFRHSTKIQAGKNFSGKTFDDLVDWTRLHTSVLSQELALYFK